MSTILYIVLGGAAVYAALVGWVYVTQRSMTYFPGADMGHPADAGAPDMTTVRLRTEDGLDLDAWYKAPKAGSGVLVYFHGNAGTIAGRVDKARPYLDAGLGVLLVEYRGYGGNPGRPNERGLYADGRAALSFLADQEVAPGRWVVYGESIGSAIAVEVAHAQAQIAGAPVGALVLEAPFTSLVAVGKVHYPYLPVDWLAKDRYPSIDKIAAVGAPVLIVHGKKDRTVPATQGRALFDAARSPKEAIWLMGASHNDLYDYGAVRRILAVLERWGLV